MKHGDGSLEPSHTVYANGKKDGLGKINKINRNQTRIHLIRRKHLKQQLNRDMKEKKPYILVINRKIKVDILRHLEWC